MEFSEPLQTNSKESIHLKPGDLDLTSNWKIVNEKLLHNTISAVDVTRSPGRAELEDVVSLETCIRLEGDAEEKREPCSITIKLKNGQRISRIAIVSEAFLIEIYKQFGEYVTTVHAEFIDEFEQSAVYFADVSLSPPTPEISIKFARLKTPGAPMWLYGIRLSLTESLPDDKTGEQFNYTAIGSLLQSKSKTKPTPVDLAMKILERSEIDEKNHGTHDMDSFLRDFMTVNIDKSKHANFLSGDMSRACSSSRKENIECIGDSKDVSDSKFKTYIDDRLREMEERLTQRIETMNCRTNEKLDNIIKLLGDKSH